MNPPDNNNDTNSAVDDTAKQFFQPIVNPGPAPGTTVGPTTDQNQSQVTNSTYSSNQMVYQSPEKLNQQANNYGQNNTLQSEQSQPLQEMTQGPVVKKSNKTMMIIVIGAVVFLLIMTALALVMGGSYQKKNPTKTTQTSQTQTNTSIDPATSLGVEQINNSINQDITSQNDDTDFPPTQLDDKALEL